MIFAPAADPNAVSHYCESKLTDARVKCAATVSSKSGDDYAWTVTKPGEYEVEVFAPAKKVPFDPQLIIKNAAGEEVANVEGGIGENAKATFTATAGTYTVVVKPGDDYMVKGGFSYDFEIRSLSAAPVAGAPVAAGEKAPAAAPAAGGETVKMDAPALAVEFLKDAKSLSKYEGKQLELKGVLATVEKDVDFSVAAFEVPMAEKFNIAAHLPADTKLKKGQLVTLRGTAEFDEEGGMMMLIDAEVVSTGNNTAMAPKAPVKPAAKKGKK
jgi:plastocyanin